VSKIVIFSAASESAAANLQHSVIEGVDLGVLGESRMLAELETRVEEGRVRLWGIQPGARAYKRASWARVDPPAVAFFYTAEGFRHTATIWAKEPAGPDGAQGNPALAEAVWGDPTFELVGYLEDVVAVDVTAEELKAALGYQPEYRIGRESIVPGEEVQDQVIAAFGSAEAFRSAVVGHAGTPPLAEFPATGLPVDSLGAAYRPEDEEATAERSQVYKVDPDRIDRGTQAHKRTQNMLAAHLEGRGLTPKSWSRAEPPYDLAWEEGDTLFVAEIKSLTRQNEERQLRLALGQILRYAHQLAYKDKAIRKIIALERRPTDATWTELCATHDVLLVWPETFANLAGARAAKTP
jgi:hypothetical protein